jgi:hypothetical protein
VLLLVGLASSGTILQYADEDRGITHVLSGEPGVQVIWNKIIITCDEDSLFFTNVLLQTVPKISECRNVLVQLKDMYIVQ